jgi:hypothetical protein
MQQSESDRLHSQINDGSKPDGGNAVVILGSWLVSGSVFESPPRGAGHPWSRKILDTKFSGVNCCGATKTLWANNGLLRCTLAQRNG